MTQDDTKKLTFDDLIAAAVEETLQDKRAKEAQRQAAQEALDHRRMTEFKSVLDACLNPVIAAACVLRYEATTRSAARAQGEAHVQAVLTVDGETWMIWTYSWKSSYAGDSGELDTRTARFLFEGPQQRESLTQSANPEHLQTALLTAIAQRRQQRASTDNSK